MAPRERRPARRGTARSAARGKGRASRSARSAARGTGRPARSAARATRRRGPRSAAERVTGLLVMLPWVMARTRVSIATMARQFDLTEAELIEDLQMAAVCGVPPYTPDALIDVFMDGGEVIAEVPLVFSRPLKLNTAELFALRVMGEAALAMPGAAADGPLATALAKLRPLMPAGADTVAVDLPKARFVKELRAAVETCERQEIDYFSPSSRARTTRAITPRRVFEDAGRWYVTADDHLSGADRVFRIDRIERVTPLGIRDEPRPLTDDDLPWFSADLPTVTLRVGPEARWIVETYPYVQRTERADGGLEVTLSVTSEHWLGRLLLRAGRSAEVLEPATYRGIGVMTARRVLARYEAGA